MKANVASLFHFISFGSHQTLRGRNRTSLSAGYTTERKYREEDLRAVCEISLHT